MKKLISMMLCITMCLSIIMSISITASAAGGQCVKDGLYTLKNVSSGYMLNVYAGKDANGTKVTTWEYDGTTDQRIYIQHQGNGKYLLKFNASGGGRVVDVNRGESLTASIDDGDKIDIWTANDLDAQYFYINPCGDGSYTFELVSKSNHVIAATSGSTAASNGTQLQLKRYSGAAYQKWYICNTGGSKINACNHNNTSNNKTDTLYESINDGQHKTISKYNIVCNDCGDTIKSNQSESKTESHNISNNKCSICGYEKEIEIDTSKEECKHSNTYEQNTESFITEKDNTSHIVKTVYDVYCSDCKVILSKAKEKTSTESHNIINGKCDKCSYKTSDSELSECEHNNTEKRFISDERQYIEKNENVHKVVNYYNIFCLECKSNIKENLSDEYDENHIINNNNKCICGYEVRIRNKTINDGLYNIQNSASRYMLNVYAGKDANGTKVTIWENDNSNDQKIYISYQGDGKYLLKYNSSQNGRVIDVNRGESLTASIDDGDKIDIWTANDLEAQLFYINDCGNGQYSFELVAKQGYVIAPINKQAAQTNGSQLELKKYVNADYQKWYINSTETISKVAYVYNTDGLNLNMRSAYNTSSSIVARIPEYSSITVIGNVINGFYPIKYNGDTGYAHSGYVTFSVPIREEKITAWVYKTGGDNLNVRSAPVITTGNIIGKFTSNQQVTLLGKTIQNGFYKVKYGNQTGYVSAGYITFSKPTSSSSYSKPSGSSSNASSNASNNSINIAQNNTSQNMGKVNQVKALLPSWKSALDAKKYAAKTGMDVINSVNIRTGIQKLLGVSTMALVTKSPSALKDMFDTDAIIGALSLKVANDYYNKAVSLHNTFNQRSKNITNEAQAKAAFEAFRDSLAYYDAVDALNIDTVKEYTSKKNYTKNMLKTYFHAVKDSAIPDDVLPVLQNICSKAQTTEQIVSAIEKNNKGTNAIRATRTQWNNIWAKLK